MPHPQATRPPRRPTGIHRTQRHRRHTPSVNGAPEFHAPLVNIRPLNEQSMQRSPDPLRQGDVVTRSARMPHTFRLGIAAITAVSRWPNLPMVKTRRGSFIRMPPGRQAPGVASVGNRRNIESSPTRSWGNLQTLYPNYTTQ